MNTIGQRIEYLRDLYDINQNELAKKIGVTNATMSKYENNINIPNAEILSKIADVLNTSTDYLTGRTSHIRPRSSDLSKEYSTEALFDMILKLNEENKIRVFERVLSLWEEQNEK